MDYKTIKIVASFIGLGLILWHLKRASLRRSHTL